MMGRFWHNPWCMGFLAAMKLRHNAWQPLLTLSRIDPPASVSVLIASKPAFDIRTTVDRVILYRSRLGGGPARYEEVTTLDLEPT